QRIHLLAHSMGNFALRHAVQGMRLHVGDQLPRLFDEVLLMAADADNDALSHPDKLAPLERLARRVTTYYNVQDLALVVSDWTKLNPDRL
ncbi:alpha/beta hydrolase, partial [Tritonibacter sp. SIMBA_163]|uniref:alpha/beta hydrolase n=1 Tax=Tritonibacter sp. SIMBA_163 TaxID=3080868 RepID=UPI00397F8732